MDPLLGGDQGRAAAAEEIEDVLAGPRRVLESAHGKFDGFLGQVHHVLRIYFLYRPHVGGIGGAKEVMRSTFTPAIKTPFMVPHEVLAGEDGMLFHPDDGLREMQAGGLESRWIVAAVAVAAP